MGTTQAPTKYRAQVEGAERAGRWVDGGLFSYVSDAERDAERLAELYGLPVRVIEESDPYTPEATAARMAALPGEGR